MTVISGDAIRMMNYVDDISATLRRMLVNIPTMSPEERKRVAEYFRNSEPNILGVIELLEKK